MILLANPALDDALGRLPDPIERRLLVHLLLRLLLVGDEVHVGLFGDDGGGGIRTRPVVVTHAELVEGFPAGHRLRDQLLFHFEGAHDLDLLVVLILDELGGDLVVAHPLFRRLRQTDEVALLDLVGPTAHRLRHLFFSYRLLSVFTEFRRKT